jgi:hypothetical protein
MDSWLPCGSTRHLIHGPLTQEEHALKVSHFIFPSRTWNLTNITLSLPDWITDLIKATPIPMYHQSQDEQIWPKPGGVCTVKSAYLTLTNSFTNPTTQTSWHWIWRIQALPKIKMFIWRCAHNQLPKKDRIFRTSPDQQICPRCGSIETTIHVLRDCIWAQHIWAGLPIPITQLNFFHTPLHAWLQENTTFKEIHFNITPPWHLLFIYTLWNLWISRNRLVFHRDLWNIPQTPFHIHNQTKEYFFLIFWDPQVNKKTIPTLFVGFPPPPPPPSLLSN